MFCVDSTMWVMPHIILAVLLILNLKYQLFIGGIKMWVSHLNSPINPPLMKGGTVGL